MSYHEGAIGQDLTRDIAPFNFLTISSSEDEWTNTLAAHLTNSVFSAYLK
jgi:hypothetical protein